MCNVQWDLYSNIIVKICHAAIVLACAADGVRLLAGGNNNRLLFPPASNLTPSAAQATIVFSVNDSIHDPHQNPKSKA